MRVLKFRMGETQFNGMLDPFSELRKGSNSMAGTPS
jgi:hypothetical protein